jgi:hypothetical protein
MIQQLISFDQMNESTGMRRAYERLVAFDRDLS